MTEFDVEQFRLAILDDDIHDLRTTVCNTVADALEESGRRLWVFGLAIDQPHRTATALVTQMGGELGKGAALLFSAKNWYAGAALVRQLVEFEYLMYLFSTDQDEPARWLTISRAELRGLYSPGRMRTRSGNRFRNEEYWAHCTMGGHPNPRAHSLLPEHSFPLESKRLLWVDLAQHLERVWDYFVNAVEQHELGNIGQIQEDKSKISALLHQWHEQDYCSSRISDEGLSSLRDAFTQGEKPSSLSAYLRSLE